MNIHASLIVDMFQYNYDWLYNVLKDGIYEERHPNTLDVVRYTFDRSDIDKLYIWTNDTKNGIGKYNKIKKLGYQLELINSINFYEDFYDPYKDRDNLVLNRFIRNSKSIPISFCYGPIFLNGYTSIDWHKSQFDFIWKRIKETANKVYLDFNVNEKYLTTAKYNGRPLNENEREDFIKYAEKITGKKIYIKPDYSFIDSKKDFDLGIKNFCFSKSYINPGIDNMYEQGRNAIIHFPNSYSLILNKRANEKIFQWSIRKGKYDQAVKEITQEDKDNKSKSFFDILDMEG